MTRLLKYIKEEYLMRGKDDYKNSYEIFINPSQKEMRELDEGTGIRFIADSRDKNIYAWNSMAAIHVTSWKQIKPKENGKTLSQRGIILEGIATKKPGKYKMIISDQIDAYFGYEKDDLEEFRKKFKWVNKYINIDDTLSDWIEMSPWEE